MENIVDIPKPKKTIVESFYTDRSYDKKSYPEATPVDKKAWKTVTTEIHGEAPAPDWEFWTGVAVVVTCAAICVAAYMIVKNQSDQPMIPAPEEIQ